jgi:hypothetical protein
MNVLAVDPGSPFGRMLTGSTQNACPPLEQNCRSLDVASCNDVRRTGYARLDRTRTKPFSVVAHVAQPWARCSPNQACAASWCT